MIIPPFVVATWCHARRLKCWVGIGVVIAVLIGAEFGLRRWDKGFSLTSESRQYSINPELSRREIFGTDYYLLWRLRSQRFTEHHCFTTVTYRINRYGLRGDSGNVSKPSGVFRIILLGDSVIFGWGLQEQDTLGARLEGLLKSQLRNKKIEIINAGVPGYSSLQGYRLLKRDLLRFKPDLVVVAFGMNDAKLSDENRRDKDWSASSLFLLQLDNLFSSSRAYTKIKGMSPWWREHSSPTIPLRRVEAADFQKNLELVRELGVQNGFSVLFLKYPSRFSQYLRWYHAAVSAVEENKAEGAVLSLLQIWGVMRIWPDEYEPWQRSDGKWLLFAKSGPQPLFIRREALLGMEGYLSQWAKTYVQYTQLIPPPCLDLDNMVAQRHLPVEGLLYDLCHPTALGNEVFARMIVEYLLKEQIVS